jgi:hypothetical protein
MFLFQPAIMLGVKEFGGTNMVWQKTLDKYRTQLQQHNCELLYQRYYKLKIQNRLFFNFRPQPPPPRTPTSAGEAYSHLQQQCKFVYMRYGRTYCHCFILSNIYSEKMIIIYFPTPFSNLSAISRCTGFDK